MPRIQQVIHSFTTRELLYLVHGFDGVDFLPKPFAKQLEAEIMKAFANAEEMDLELVQLMARVFCRTRAGSRDYHKLLDTTMLMRLEELKKHANILNAIGYEFESSGLCSLDVLKILKRAMLQVQVEQDTFQ